VRLKIPQEGEREHQLVEQQLQKMSAADDKMSEAWITRTLPSFERKPLI